VDSSRLEVGEWEKGLFDRRIRGFLLEPELTNEGIAVCHNKQKG